VIRYSRIRQTTAACVSLSNLRCQRPDRLTADPTVLRRWPAEAAI